VQNLIAWNCFLFMTIMPGFVQRHSCKEEGSIISSSMSIV